MKDYKNMLNTEEPPDHWRITKGSSKTFFFTGIASSTIRNQLTPCKQQWFIQLYTTRHMFHFFPPQIKRKTIEYVWTLAIIDIPKSKLYIPEHNLNRSSIVHFCFQQEDGSRVAFPRFMKLASYPPSPHSSLLSQAEYQCSFVTFHGTLHSCEIFPCGQMLLSTWKASHQGAYVHNKVLVSQTFYQCSVSGSLFGRCFF